MEWYFQKKKTVNYEIKMTTAGAVTMVRKWEVTLWSKCVSPRGNQSNLTNEIQWLEMIVHCNSNPSYQKSSTAANSTRAKSNETSKERVTFISYLILWCSILSSDDQTLFWVDKQKFCGKVREQNISDLWCEKKKFKKPEGRKICF